MNTNEFTRDLEAALGGLADRAEDVPSTQRVAGIKRHRRDTVVRQTVLGALAIVAVGAAGIASVQALSVGEPTAARTIA